ncbi:MAG TPA: sigma-54 dependent transcriptional regulator [Vicinamibacterales bacterium]|jgi:DNA-binding NtrC family response regulator|nr:sigma-54 dependent transcriptional regulator [Vicinamibacterales bacterium]
MSSFSVPRINKNLPVLLGESPAIVALRREIEAAARTDAKVLVLGETGAGKEVVARLIHEHSSRVARAFVAVNCSGIPETLLESELFGHARGSFTGAYRDKPGLVRQADRGTLFLDELGEMSLRMQAVLLRFAETGEIQTIGVDGVTGRSDVRLITATNRNLRERIDAGVFREDLYFRLNIIQIHVPPLRERAEDVLLLLQHYLRRAADTHRLHCPELTADAEQLLVAYGWPGNVRELKNLAERLVVREWDRAITADDLPIEIRGGRETAPTVSVPNVSFVPDQNATAPRRIDRGSGTADRLWERLIAGESFWTVVHQPFKAHELTRDDLAALIHRGLEHTRGSYRALLGVFGLPPTDYKRFHAFLYQQNCNLPVGPYRTARASMRRQDRPSSAYTPAC